MSACARRTGPNRAQIGFRRRPIHQWWAITGVPVRAPIGSTTTARLGLAQPIELAWYRRPMTALRGRPPVWASLVFVLAIAAAAVVVGLAR